MNRKILRFLTACLLCLLASASAMADAPAVDMTQEDILKSGESYTQVFDINGRTFLFFAQNSPEWNMLLASKDTVDRRTFGSSGCAAAALSNVLINVLPRARLHEVTALAQRTVCVDSRSLVDHKGKTDGRFIVEKESDFVRFWPLVIGNITAENNTLGIRENRNSNYYARFFDFFGLRYKVTNSHQEMLSALDEGAIVVTCSSGQGSPYAVRGHYLTYAAKDEEYIYVLDSYVRSSFPKDTRRVVEILQPGLERVRIEHLNRIQTGSMYLVWPDENAEKYTPELLAEIIRASNAHE